MCPPKTDTTKRQQKYYGVKLSYKISMSFETEVPEIVCIFKNERSKPPVLAEKSKYLTINKHGNIALFKIFSFQIQKKYAFWKQSCRALHNKTFKAMGVLGHLCKYTIRWNTGKKISLRRTPQK